MTPQERVLTTAAKFVGVTESPPNSNLVIFSAELDAEEKPPIPRNGSRWCGSYVDDVFKLSLAWACLPGSMFYTPSGAESFKRDHAWYADPQPGDCAFWFNTQANRISHVGIIERVDADPRYVWTFEGNTSPSDSGSVFNGGCVAHKRRLHSFWTGFGRPDWSKAGPDTSNPLRDLLAACRRTTLEQPMTGVAVSVLQSQLNMPVTGVYDARTESMVTEFQRWFRGAQRAEGVTDSNYLLAVTGICDPHTWACLALKDG